MRGRWHNTLVLLPILLLSEPALGLDADDILGHWRPPSGGRIEIAPCGDRLCGHIRPLDPQPGERNGYMLLEDFVYEGDLKWKKGRIHDPESGRSYDAKLRLLNRNELKVSGCLWIFCGSQTWIRRE